jgi:steroid delta-isomerase-like uncharacterized protein
VSAEENKAIARRAYEIFSSGNLEALQEVIAPDLVDHNAAPGQAPGIEGTRQVLGMLRAAFPDLRLTPEDLIAEGDRVVARLMVTGTHQGEFQGLPPTGKQVTMSGIEIVRLAGGKAVERWGEFDILGLLQQLGAVPAPGAAG